MSTPVGFRYLYEVGFIEREMDAWLRVSTLTLLELIALKSEIIQERNFNYVVEVELYLSRELHFNSVEDEEDPYV